LDPESKRSIYPYSWKKNFIMETTAPIVSELICELSKKLKSVEEDQAPDVDWSNWLSLVRSLRAHLDEQLKSSSGKFRVDTANVSATAEHASVINSINNFKSSI